MAVAEVVHPDGWQARLLREPPEELREVVGVDRPSVRLREDEPVILPRSPPHLAFVGLSLAPIAQSLNGAAVEVDGAATPARLGLGELGPPVDLDALAQDPQAVNDFRAGRYPTPMLQERRLPRDVAELRDRLDSYRAELGLTAESRRALRFLLWPPLSLAIKSAYLPVLAGAIATLEPDLRRRLRLPLPWPARTATTAEVRTFLRLLRIAVGAPPSRQTGAHERGSSEGTRPSVHRPLRN